MRLRSRSGKSLVLILGACITLSLGIGVGLGLFAARRASGSPGKHGEGKPKHVEPALIYSLGETVVNLADTDTLRYAKVTVALGFDKKLSEEKLKEVTPLLRDAVITVFTSRRFTDLRRTGGIGRAKEEIKKVVESRFHEAKVAEVYFESFAMQ